MIRPACQDDAAAIADIYNFYVLNTVVTFEEEPVSVPEMWRRIAEVQQKFPWLVYELDGKVVGYAYAGMWKVRSAYRFTVESSIYLAAGNTGRGIGSALYRELINEVSKLGVHAIIGGAAMPNDASVKLHESLGFKKIGQFIETGFKMGKWVDVCYWELIPGRQ